MDKLVAHCRRRGFIFPGSLIYGGFANSFDYGPLGARMKDNIVRKWKRDFVLRRTDTVPIDSAVISHPAVWRTSGHLDLFQDVFVACTYVRSLLVVVVVADMRGGWRRWSWSSVAAGGPCFARCCCEAELPVSLCKMDAFWRTE